MGKLLLIAGASGTGKTSVCDSLSREYGMSHRRHHEYVIELAKKNGVSLEELSQRWNDFSAEGLKLLLLDAMKSNIGICTDKHLAVQPVFDTNYARGIRMEEDLNEPYERGLSDVELKLPEFRDVDLYFFLMESSPEEILRRRLDLKDKKAPRSLNPVSIVQEMKHEYKYFLEACELLSHYSRPNVSVISNGDGKISETIRRISEILWIGQL